MKIKSVILMIIFMIAAAGMVIAAEQNKGAEKIDLYGGNNGDIPFPHLQHQTALKDCNTCHELFPQEAGSIEKLKAEKKLMKKQVMNTQCLQCHRDKKKEDAKTGPTSCNKCHIKK